MLNSKKLFSLVLFILDQLATAAANTVIALAGAAALTGSSTVPLDQFSPSPIIAGLAVLGLFPWIARELFASLLVLLGVLVPELRDADAAAFTSMRVAVAAISVALMVAGVFNHVSFVVAAFAWSLTAQVALAVRS